MSQILIVEDEPVIRSSLKKLLERNDYLVQEAGSVDEGQAILDSKNIDLVISDLRLPGRDGTALIEIASPIPVLIMTSYASLESAVEAIKMGAVDYISKPFDHEEMSLSVARILKEVNLARQNEALRSDLSKSYPIENIIGSCDPMQQLFKQINKVAPTDTTVLIYGESGTGKELVARAIHEKSLRQDGPLISVNCAAIPETLIESELFGHDKGAFTGANTNRKGLVEAANNGTLFLDEIGELPLEAQARLLRLLQEKEVRRLGSVEARSVDVRVVAATHRDLKYLVAEGRFRDDLFYRLNVVGLKLPPLRERGNDVIELANALLARICNKLNCSLFEFSPEAIDVMLKYSWPGNVRELENAIERAVILCEDKIITPSLLAIDMNAIPQQAASTAEASTPVDDSSPAAEESLEDYFQRFVLEHQDEMTETELAQKLGISRKSLWQRRQKLGIPRKKTGNRRE